MPQASRPPQADSSQRPPAQRLSARLGQSHERAFFGLLDVIIVEDPVELAFDGALSREHANAVWTWLRRDVAPDLIPPTPSGDDPQAAAVLDAAVPQILVRVHDILSKGRAEPESERRLKSQLGGEDAWGRLPLVLSGLKNRMLLEKARAFGRATNALQDEATVAVALQSLPSADFRTTAMLMQAAIGQVASPTRLVKAAIRIAGDAREGAIRRAGFAPMIDAILAHAQNQIHVLSPMGAFADIDLTCRTIDRFHKLVRAISGYIEIQRMGPWSKAIALLTKRVSERIEPKLRQVGPDVNQSLRRVREGADRLDSDGLLAALNGVYLLATVRDCRDSLALNALFDQSWAMVGEVLEVQLNRNLDVLKANPTDAVASARLEMGIKMAELRFNADYADVLRRAREQAERWVG